MSRGVRFWIVAAVVLVGLLIAADRVALVICEGVAAKSIKSSQHLASEPSVSAPGFPFLPHLISGHYPEVDVKAHGLDVGPQAHPLRIDTVSVTLHDVHISNGFDVVKSARAEATALITYTDLSTTLGTAVKYAGNARVSATVGVTVAGVPLNGTVSTKPVLASSNGLGFTDTQVSALGTQAPPQLTQALNGVFNAAISLESLPFDLRFTSITATQQGVVVTLVGTDLEYANTGTPGGGGEGGSSGESSKSG